MTRQARGNHEMLHESLPPLERRLYDPRTDGLIQTPLDYRGLVDAEALVEVVRQTVDPDYDWPSSFSDIHHLQWPNRWYENDRNAQVNPSEFRDLAISKVYVPRVFHNWVHKITEPPPMPKPEVMYYRTEAQRVALALFRTARAGKTVTRIKNISEAKLEHRLIEYFDDFSSQVEVARTMPRDYQLIDFTEYYPRDYDDMFELGARLGRLATRAAAAVTQPGYRGHLVLQ